MYGSQEGLLLGRQCGRESQIIIVEPACECQRLLTLVIPVFRRPDDCGVTPRGFMIFQLTLQALRLMGEAMAGRPQMALERWAVSKKPG